MKFIVVFIFLILIALAGGVVFCREFWREGRKCCAANKDRAKADVVLEQKDFFNACLFFESEYYGNVDTEKANQAFSRICEDVKLKIQGISDPMHVMQTINKYLLHDRNVKLSDQVLVENLLPDKVLENCKGHCFGLSMLYLALADRLNIPVFLKVVPFHVFLCYDDGTTSFNFDLVRGDNLPDTEYSVYFSGPAKCNSIRRLSKREAIGLFLSNLANYLNGKETLQAHMEALRLLPDMADVHIQTGIFYNRRDKLTEAEKYLTQGIQLDPYIWYGYSTLAEVYFKEKEYSKSCDTYLKCIDLLRMQIKVKNYVSNAPSDSTINELLELYGANEATFHEYLEMHNVSDLAVAILLCKQGNFSLAKKLCDRVIELQPQSVLAHSCCAVANFHLGNYAISRNHAEKVDKINGYPTAYNVNYYLKTISDSYVKLGQSYLKLGEPKLAADAINKAIEIGGAHERYSGLLIEARSRIPDAN